MMSERTFLVEPKQLEICRTPNKTQWNSYKRENDDHANSVASNRGIRSAGDGMEFKNESYSLQNIEYDWQHGLKKPIATSTPSPKELKLKTKKNITQKSSKEILKEMKKVDSFLSMEEKINQSYQKEIEDLKKQQCYLEDLNEKLVEEKLKLSKQLGIQSQVNTELKTLLVASVGEDLEQKLEKMTLSSATSERLIKKLKEQIEEKNEELESMTIQCDVWRSKFLASKVMADEMASLKAQADSRHRECNSALETLLEEHVQASTTIASANRFLLRLANLSGCTVNEDDFSNSSSIDLAITNHSLARQVTYKVIRNSSSNAPTRHERSHDIAHRSNQSMENMNIKSDKAYVPSEGEKKAKKALEASKVEQIKTAENRNPKFLAYERISQILATKYQLRCLTCKGCKGQLINI